MKKVSVIFLVVLSFVLSRCGPTTQDAMNYNDKLIAEETAVIDAINAVDNAFATYDPAEIEPAMNNAKEQIEKSIAAVKETGDFDGDSKFKDDLLALFELFKKQLNTEYAEQLEIYKLSDDEYTEREESRYNELLNQMDTDYNVVFNKFMDTQREFADKWGFDLR